MIKVNSQYPSRIKYVKHSTTNSGLPMTKFSIGDKVKGSEKDYINYDVTVFADLPLQDGDEVVLTSIGSIESRLYNDKVYHSLVATVQTNKPVEDDSELPPFDI